MVGDAAAAPSLGLGGRHRTLRRVQRAPESLQKDQQAGQVLDRELGLGLHPVEPPSQGLPGLPLGVQRRPRCGAWGLWGPGFYEWPCPGEGPVTNLHGVQQA